MQTKQNMFLDLMGQQDTQFIIPVYQRSYAWTQRQCEELWRDVLRAGRNKAIHFIGTLLYVVEKESCSAAEQQRSIVDGQQRTATLTLLLVAFREYLKKNEGAVEGVSTQMLDEKYLHAGNGSEQVCKLILSRLDKDTLIAVVDQTPVPEESSERVLSNLDYFSKLMRAPEFDPNMFWEGMNRLMMINAELGPDDHAQYIFDSLNSKGMPLTTADLVRNHFLISQSHTEQTRLYNEYWLPIESMFDNDKDHVKLNNAIWGWLQVNVPDVRAHKRDQVYDVFKHYMQDKYEGSIEDLLTDLRSFAQMYAENFKFNEVKDFRTKDSSAYRNKVHADMVSKMPHRFSQGGF